jgi:prolyl 4-hydroxylase
LPPSVDGYAVGGLCSEMRFYKYEKGQKFSPHSDNGRYLTTRDGPKTLYTVLCFLNEEGLVGGQTRFPKINGFPLIITPETGTVLLFRHHLVHQGLEVKRGFKYLLKTDLYFTPIKNET